MINFSEIRSSEYPVAGKQIQDANIFATMLAFDIPALLTHNTVDFQRLTEVINVIFALTEPGTAQPFRTSGPARKFSSLRLFVVSLFASKTIQEIRGRNPILMHAVYAHKGLSSRE